MYRLIYEYILTMYIFKLPYTTQHYGINTLEKSILFNNSKGEIETKAITIYIVPFGMSIVDIINNDIDIISLEKEYMNCNIFLISTTNLSFEELDSVTIDNTYKKINHTTNINIIKTYNNKIDAINDCKNIIIYYPHATTKNIIYLDHTSFNNLKENKFFTNTSSIQYISFQDRHDIAPRSGIVCPNGEVSIFPFPSVKTDKVILLSDDWVVFENKIAFKEYCSNIIVYLITYRNNFINNNPASEIHLKSNNVDFNTLPIEDVRKMTKILNDLKFYKVNHTQFNINSVDTEYNILALIGYMEESCLDEFNIVLNKFT